MLDVCLIDKLSRLSSNILIKENRICFVLVRVEFWMGILGESKKRYFSVGLW